MDRPVRRQEQKWTRIRCADWAGGRWVHPNSPYPRQESPLSLPPLSRDPIAQTRSIGMPAAGSTRVSGTGMILTPVFAKRLRERVVNGQINSSIGIWTSPHGKVGKRRSMGEGQRGIESILRIGLPDISPELARESGFDGVINLLKVAKHGKRRQRLSDSLSLRRSRPHAQAFGRPRLSSRLTRSAAPTSPETRIRADESVVRDARTMARFRLGQ